MDPLFSFGGSTGSPTPAGATSALTVATPAALSLVSVIGMPDGAMVSVNSLRDAFVLETSSTAPDGITIATSPTAGRVWRRLGMSSPAWLDPTAAPSYAIDGSTGDDLAAGDALHPIATWAELDRRIHDQPIAYPMAVSIANYDGPALVRLTVDSFTGGKVTISGTPNAALHTGTVNVYTAKAPASNLPYRLTDAGVADWSPYIGKRLRLTSGAESGAVAWVLKNVAGTAWTSPWCSPNGGFAAATPAHGDAYVIETLPTVLPTIRILGNPIPGNGPVLFSGLTISGTVADSSVLLVFFGCDVTELMLGEGTSALLFGCLGMPLMNPGSSVSMTRCAPIGSNATFGSNPPGTLTTFDDVVAINMAGGVVVNSSTVLVSAGGLGVFDSGAGAGIAIHGDGVYVTKRGILHTIGPLYGSGHVGVGVRADGGCVPEYIAGQKPTITGTGGDVILAGAGAITWAGSIPASISTSTGAGYLAV
jgi:hypothetical protein